MRLDAHFDMLPDRAFKKRGFGRAPATLEGGGKGGGSAPSPDPNIGKAQLQLAQISQQYLDSWRTEVWPSLKEQTLKQEARADEQFALDKELQNMQMTSAKESMERYNKFAKPLQEKIFAEAETAGSKGEIERQSALAMGDVSDQFNKQRQASDRQMQAYGINPTAGSYQNAKRVENVMEAATGAAAATKARTAAEQLGWAKRMDAAALAQGQFGNQATSTGLALSAGNQALNAGQTTMGNYGAMGSSMGQAYGGAMQGWGQVGTLGVQKYNADVNAYSAQQQSNAASSAGWGSGIGALAGAGMKAYATNPAAFSDIRMKENVKHEGKTPAGTNIYSFEYKQEFKDMAGYGRYIGVMAHEVPEAAFEHESGYKMVDYSKVQ